MNEITTQQKWDDLLPVTAINNLKQLLDNWVQNKKPSGILFLYGGDAEKRKSVAALAGLHTTQKVYKADMTAISTNYIGETEKNLRTVFTEAEQNNWILFFDEADSLFGKRSSVKNAHDLYATIEVNWLLQKIEACGIHVIISGDAAVTSEPFSKHFFALIDCTA